MIKYEDVVHQIKISSIDSNIKKILFKTSKHYFNGNLAKKQPYQKYNSDEKVLKEVDLLTESLGMFKNGTLNYDFITNNKTLKLLYPFNVNEIKVIINKIASGLKLDTKGEKLKYILKELNLVYDDNILNYNKDIIKFIITKTVTFLKHKNSIKYEKTPMSQW